MRMVLAATMGRTVCGIWWRRSHGWSLKGNCELWRGGRASQACHELVAPKGMFASRNVMFALSGRDEVAISDAAQTARAVRESDPPPNLHKRLA
jgi:hypothetical protein